MECRERTLSRTLVQLRSSRLLRSRRRGYQHNERRVSIQSLLCATNDFMTSVGERACSATSSGAPRRLPARNVEADLRETEPSRRNRKGSRWLDLPPGYLGSTNPMGQAVGTDPDFFPSQTREQCAALPRS